MAEATPENGSTKSNKWLLLVVLMAVLGASGGAGWYYMFSHDSADHGPKEPPPPVFVDLEPFTVNLQPDREFLQATFTFQIADEKSAEILKRYMPQVRSRILLMLSAKTAEILAKPEGKTAVINEIKTLIEEPFELGVQPIKLNNVFVSSFIIQ